MGMRGTLAVVLLAGATMIGAASAQAGSEWTGNGMQSRHRSLLSAESRAPRIEGIDRYEQIRKAPTEAPRRTVPETLAVKSQRPWEPGARRVTPRSRAGRSASGPGFVATRNLGTPGGRTSNGGSSLRGGIRTTPSR